MPIGVGINGVGINSVSAINSSMFFLLIVIMLPSQYLAEVYNITSLQPLVQGQTLVSPSQVFELGFFSPNSSANKYVGLWHRSVFPRKIVWVANRENPLAATDSSATLRIGSNGNLELVDGKQSSVWSTNVSVPTNVSAAVLLDSGSFVLKDDMGAHVWQSLDYPCDSLLPSMLLGFDSNTGEWNLLRSWKGENDPSPGIFSIGLSAQMPTQMFVWKNGATPHWRSGPWDKSKFVGVPGMSTQYLSGFTLDDNVRQGTRYFSYSLYDNSIATLAYLDITSEGIIRLMLSKNDENWSRNFAAPTNACDSYGACGPFGYCKASEPPVCKCLKGFRPKSVEEWSKRNWTGGCVRQNILSCDTNTSVSSVGKKDGFWKLGNLKIPDFHEYRSSLSNDVIEDCKTQCLSNCSCLAYAYVTNIGCLVWSKELIDIQELTSDGEELFIRLAHKDLVEGNRTKLIVSLTVIFFICILGSIVFIWQRFSAIKKGNMEVTTKRLNDTTEVSTDVLLECIREHDQAEQFIYHFDSILIATNNFSSINKLGEGGFGPVYKGKLQEGKEIAVKRLSRSSVQGEEEFKNEMLLISKLQHKNLVKIMGCCVTKDEKLLIYEFMENKSLDALLFDRLRKAELSWTRRFNIIQGVTRGLLYLHHDSCLKVIHRDLKVSNILLDENMNPKISDFGLARIVQGTENLENTQKVMGTRGYMSPEYVMGGKFSEKSDVYSFGVLVLEIISGKKNNSFYYDDQVPSLLAHAWQLWSEGRGLELVDEVLADLYSSSEVLRCLQIGLLCVQDNAMDRPSMPEVVLMLSSNTDNPQPKKPIFTFHNAVSAPQQQYMKSPCSGSEATMTLIEGR